MNNQNAQIQEIKNLIQRDEIEKALDILNDLFQDNNSIKEILFQKGRFVNLLRNDRLGVISYTEINIERNKIRKSLIDLLIELEKNQSSKSRQDSILGIKKWKNLNLPITLTVIVSILVIIILELNISDDIVNYGRFIDPRDNQSYRTILMRDGKIWMAENMRYKVSNIEDRSWCPDNEKQNCKKYGKLYNWESVQEVCPEGWHLPSDDEWWEMIQEYGGADQAFLIRARTRRDKTNGEDAYWELFEKSKFKIQLSGMKVEDGFFRIGRSGNYWTSSPSEKDIIIYYEFDGNSSKPNITQRTINDESYFGFSCRCIKNENG